jgi:hypothetical protein
VSERLTRELDLRSVDFGPKRQEPPGARIGSLAPPPRTAMIRPSLLLRDDIEVLANLRKERRSAEVASSVELWRSIAEDLVEMAWDGVGRAAASVAPLFTDFGRTIATSWASFLLWLDGMNDAPGLLRIRVVTEATTLRAGKASVPIAKGARVFICPDEPAPRPGWILARTLHGDEGFVEIRCLE